MASFTTQQISDRIGGQLMGPGGLFITGVDQLDHARPGDISFVRDESFAPAWQASAASAALVANGVGLPPGPGRANIHVPNADLAMAVVLELFAPPAPLPPPGVHATATVDPSAKLADGARVGPGSVVGPGVVIGAGTIIHAHVTVLDDSRIGAGCVLWPGVVIRERCTLGDRCILHPNVTIGADGFNYRPSPDGRGLVKIPQIGTVQIGSDVEIGAGTCVDRAKFSATVIGEGTKIDNLCQIAHNVRIGRACVLAGQVGLAGSVIVGDGVVMGGKVAVKDQVTIGDGVTLAACSAVMNDVPAGETWAGMPACEMRLAMREYAAIRKLPDLIRHLKHRG